MFLLCTTAAIVTGLPVIKYIVIRTVANVYLHTFRFEQIIFLFNVLFFFKAALAEYQPPPGLQLRSRGEAPPLATSASAPAALFLAGFMLAPEKN